MVLAALAVADEDALVCDFAAEYGVYDWRALPVKTAAALAVGLSDDSRVKRRAAGTKCSLDDALLARVADEVAALRWMLSGDGRRNVNRPESLVRALTGAGDTAHTRGFASATAFEAARAAITKGAKANG